MPVRRSFASSALLPLAALVFAACTAVSEHAANTPGGSGGSAGGTDSGAARAAAAPTTTTSGGTVAAPADTTAPAAESGRAAVARDALPATDVVLVPLPEPPWPLRASAACSAAVEHATANDSVSSASERA